MPDSERTVQQSIRMKPAEWVAFGERGGNKWLARMVDGEGQRLFAQLLEIAEGSAPHTCGDVTAAPAATDAPLLWPCAACEITARARAWLAATEKVPGK